MNRHVDKKSLTKRQFRDKMVFTMNYSLLVVSILAIFKGPKHFAYLNAISVGIMMVHRIYEFYCYNWLFYLIDYCYVINTLVIIYSVFFPKNYYLFICAFAFGTGPIFTSIAYYRMGLIFHNTVKMTSHWTHYSPAVTMLLIRWYDYNNDFLGVDYFDIKKLNKTFICSFFYDCSLFYLTWFFIYYFLIFHIFREFIKKNKCETQFIYLMKKKDSNKVLTFFGEGWSEIIYMLSHISWVYGNLVLSLSQLFELYISGSLVIFLTFVSMWNSATYYMDYFSLHYVKQFELQKDDSDIYSTPI